uniref:TPR_REGION domain-containing protein n=1 Tax=Gongylonema pulchrum TaxID=637853 RepID=A0A183EPN9_9BILA
LDTSQENKESVKEAQRPDNANISSSELEKIAGDSMETEQNDAAKSEQAKIASDSMETEQNDAAKSEQAVEAGTDGTGQNGAKKEQAMDVGTDETDHNGTNKEQAVKVGEDEADQDFADNEEVVEEARTDENDEKEATVEGAEVEHEENEAARDGNAVEELKNEPVKKTEQDDTVNEEEEEEGAKDENADDEEDSEDDGADEESSDVEYLERAWETLEIARAICDRHLDEPGWKEKKVDVLLELVNCSVDAENYQLATKDIDACIALMQSIFEPNDRNLAHAYFMKGYVFSFTNDFANAVKMFEKSKELLESKLSEFYELFQLLFFALANVITSQCPELLYIIDHSPSSKFLRPLRTIVSKSQMKTKVSDGAEEENAKEIDEIEKLLPDIQAKIVDSLESAKVLAKVELSFFFFWIFIAAGRNFLHKSAARKPLRHNLFGDDLFHAFPRLLFCVGS